MIGLFREDGSKVVFVRSADGTGRVLIDGTELRCATAIAVESPPDKLVSMTVTFYPASIDVVDAEESAVNAGGQPAQA